ncbi:MAG: 16S rRNA (adenine(1518)-N(6)/adenine(1519)-N(6))-dimethyltransferase RsmA [Ferroplasma sp.]|uniref:16S rRNA (adenine(1518)-N(6)/adenine(1519)-N(6))- dimethyltransferase RsmA n=1 Tax=Ferroplasma sp. TaxID=2591003 RepID=UPI002815FC48|nr:16S rRNA (adenine(1518)-N(6)/adenine(1519)-N(6))-dimethyltransferase RsmA [Ferroplasma sp.]WMT51635.1 MAG: 16S rRNA (adenine(1518)-N(6)/adenine(1519)-N(6))-dimethyltransferase RsmA [Ferroplasma sp.]
MTGNFPKKFGQVFLRDKNIAAKEIRLLAIKDGDEVLEIGPGDGILTDILLSYPVKLTAVEPDHRFYESLAIKHAESIYTGKFKILKESFLDIQPANYSHIIGNIPYNISSQILFHLLDFNFESAVMMVQKEFALRLVAKPGTKDYSRLSVNAGLRSNIKIISSVNRQVFSPVPGVDSSIIEIRKKPYDIDIKNFDAFLIKIFTMRRKKLSTILNYNGPFSEKRPGELTIDQLIMVYSRI